MEQSHPFDDFLCKNPENLESKTPTFDEKNKCIMSKLKGANLTTLSASYLIQIDALKGNYMKVFSTLAFLVILHSHAACECTSSISFMTA